MKQELLAPAGDIEAGYAAFYYGADAVYLGLQQFSARATATNFDEKSLDEMTAFAHANGKKVYAAINTLIQEDELADLLKTLDICSYCKVDAVILQDLGVARIIKEQYPELELHASTQMAVHNKEGALALQKAGFSRVVLARELSLPEIKEIAAIPNLETEAFIHGALCYSYSGLCMFSSMESGRSANRGKCLYPCRSCFSGEDGNKHYFSMKDMALEQDVLKMPVTSLKIEGRKKSALYVAAVTDYYRRILDGKGADEYCAENIRQIFSRPWCKFHFNGKNKQVVDRDFVGHRGLFIGKIETADKHKITLRTNHLLSRHDGIQIDVPQQDKPFGFSLLGLKVKGKSVFEAPKGETVEIMLPPFAPLLEKGLDVYLASSGNVKGAYDYTKPKDGEYKQRMPIEVTVTVNRRQIKAEAQGMTAVTNGEFTVAANPQKTSEAAQKSFAKVGDTALSLCELRIENPENLFVPASMFNDLRRKLYEQITPLKKQGLLPTVSAKPATKTPKWIIKTDNFDCLAEIRLEDVDEIICLLNENTDIAKLRSLPKNKVRLALPTVCRKAKMAYFKELTATLLAQGYRRWEIGNYWGLEVLPRQGIDLSFDTPLYVLNSQAAEMAKELGAGRICLSLEDTLSNQKKLCQNSPLPVVMVVYTDIPLFTSAVCIRSNECRDCPRGEKWLKLTKGNQQYEILSRDCQIMAFAQQAFAWAKEAKDVAADYYRVDFVYKHYSADRAAAIWNKVRTFEDTDNVLKGNSFRNNNF